MKEVIKDFCYFHWVAQGIVPLSKEVWFELALAE